MRPVEGRGWQEVGEWVWRHPEVAGRILELLLVDHLMTARETRVDRTRPHLLGDPRPRRRCTTSRSSSSLSSAHPQAYQPGRRRSNWPFCVKESSSRRSWGR